jgi:hypothetical protein
MNYQHKTLAAGRWRELSFLEQMANISSEVERALDWKAKNNNEYCLLAVERALELLDLTTETTKKFTRLKELTRLREAVADYFLGENRFISSDTLWRKYFSYFSYAARKNH